MNLFIKMGSIVFALALMIFLHHTFRYTTASLFLAPAGISILLATLSPVPVTLLCMGILIFELFSSLPLGTMALVYLIPFLIKISMKIELPELSWKFLAFIAIVVTVQITLMLIIKNLFIPFEWSHIPFQQAIAQIAVTSLGTYGIAVSLYEYTSRA